MNRGQYLKNRIMRWKTILLLSSLGNIVIGGLLIHVCVRDALHQKDFGHWAAAIFFLTYFFLNVFSLVNLFFLNKLAIHLFLIIIYGSDVALMGLCGFVVRHELLNLKDQPLFEIISCLFLLGVFVLSVFSVFLLVWRLEKTEKSRA